MIRTFKTVAKRKASILVPICCIYVEFSKFYGKVGVIFLILFHLIWKNYILYWDFDLKSWIVEFFTRFTREKRPQNKFSSQNFSVGNNYFSLFFLIGNFQNGSAYIYIYCIFSIFAICSKKYRFFCMSRTAMVQNSISVIPTYLYKSKGFFPLIC